MVSRTPTMVQSEARVRNLSLGTPAPVFQTRDLVVSGPNLHTNLPLLVPRSEGDLKHAAYSRGKQMIRVLRIECQQADTRYQSGSRQRIPRGSAVLASGYPGWVPA